MSRKGSLFGGSSSRKGSLLGSLGGRKGSMKGSVKEQHEEFGITHVEGDYSRHCRLHDSANDRDVLFVMPPDNEVVVFSSRVTFARSRSTR